MRILFVEPPRDFWFVMGEYLPPPFSIIQLAAFLEQEIKDTEMGKSGAMNAKFLDTDGIQLKIY